MLTIDGSGGFDSRHFSAHVMPILLVGCAIGQDSKLSRRLMHLEREIEDGSRGDLRIVSVNMTHEFTFRKHVDAI